MRYLLDNEALEGTHEARITYRPERYGVPLTTSNAAGFIDAVRYECQLWGGATVPMVPISSDGTIRPEYARILPGAAIDGLHGLHPFDLFDLSAAKVSPKEGRQPYGTQLAVALFEHRKQDSYLRLEVTELQPDDPWRSIYAACLGLLPERPDAEVIRAGHLVPELRFEDFVNVDRVSAEGSLNDLLERLRADDRITPRRLSMVHLPYGNSGSTSIRSKRTIIPERRFPQYDAGPNVLVVCSAGSVADEALLWNLRGAHGDLRPLPIGVPVSQANAETIQTLLSEPRISRHGHAAHSIYVTSASLTQPELAELFQIGDNDDITFANCDQMLTLGYPGGWTRDEVLVWTEGKTRFVPLSPDANRAIFAERALSDLTRMQSDVLVLDSPFPIADDIRIDAPNSAFYGGTQSLSTSTRTRSEVRDIEWPSRLLMARAIAAARGLELRESEPGRAGRIALTTVGDIGGLGNFAHAPLLSMLEEMATRQGFGWYKRRLRQGGEEADPGRAIGPTIDELPEKSYSDFKRVLGNSEKATKFWLLWAEKANMIVKGFQLVCSVCNAKQWVPVAGFTPPIVCRGCTDVMKTPFGNRPNTEFRYRMSERLRRVYEQDAMGHLLVARYFYWIFYGFKGSRLIGLHPGLEVRTDGSTTLEGEADVLLLTRDAEFVPVEVKRTSPRFTGTEIAKFDHLARTLNAPWSALAVCQYGEDSCADFASLETRAADGAYTRIVLSYDALLEPYPTWSLGDDPFEWKPLSAEAITAREREFVRGLVQQADSGSFDWMADTMLHKPARPGVSH